MIEATAARLERAGLVLDVDDVASELLFWRGARHQQATGNDLGARRVLRRAHDQGDRLAFEGLIAARARIEEAARVVELDPPRGRKVWHWSRATRTSASLRY